jgi:hypothetical protein
VVPGMKPKYSITDLQVSNRFFFSWQYWDLNTQLLTCLARYSIAWGIPPALFALIISEIGSRFLPRLVWMATLLF